MTEGIVSTHQVQLSQDMKSVEVIATLDAGEVLPGMFLQIPLNRATDVTLRIATVIPQEENRIRLVLDCENDPEWADFVIALNFAEETLWVLETD